MDITTLPTWDLSDLYSGIDDTNIQRDVTILESRALAFQITYRDTLTSDTLLTALQEYSSIIEGIQKIEAYAYLEHSTHTGDDAYGAFFQNSTTKTSSIRSHLIFFEILVLEFPDETLQACIEDPTLLPFKHFLEKKRAEKKHRLGEGEENILQQKSLTGRQAFIRLQDQHLTAQTAAMEIEGETKELSVSALLHLLYSEQREVRKTASEKVAEIANRTLSQSTFTYNTLMQDFSIDATLRSFEKPEDMRHLENEVDRKSVAILQDVVQESYGVVEEYYRLKQEVLNIGPLFEYDRYAPIHTEKKTYSFAQAQDMVLSASAAFSPAYADIGKRFFEKRWIDAPSTPQKRSGAYCMYVTPDTHPLILLNYHGGRRDVSTLAHELGHGIHAYFARGQNILQFDWPITIAETASIFGEMILFKHMLAATDGKKEKLALVMEKIEEIFASTFRQISMYTFEQEAHALRAEKGELTGSNLNALWEKQQKAMFGNSLTITGAEAPFWSLIPHIFHTPFYVYSYAFGELLTLSLFALYEASPKEFPHQYIEFLSAGGSKSPHDLVSAFGIDIHKREFWERGITEISSLITLAKTYV